MKYYIEIKKRPESCSACRFFDNKNICGDGDDFMKFICIADNKIKELKTPNNKPKDCPIKTMAKKAPKKSDDSSAWDFHYSGHGDYEEERRCFYGDFG